MYRDAWGLGEAIQVFFSVGTKKTKKFVWGMCGDIPMHYYFFGGGSSPRQILLHGDLFGEDLRGSVIQGCPYCMLDQIKTHGDVQQVIFRPFWRGLDKNISNMIPDVWYIIP